MSPAAPVVAVLTIARGRHDHLASQVRALGSSDLRPDLYVVAAMDDPQIREVVRATDPAAGHTVVVDVPADPTRLPLAAARNAATAAAQSAGADVLVVLDVDCLPAPDLVRTYRDALATVDAPDAPAVVSGPVHYLAPRPPGGYTGVDLAASVPHPARPAVAPGGPVRADDVLLFWSLSFAMTTTGWERVGGFDPGYTGYGGEDTDFAMLLQQAGGALWWVADGAAYHQHHAVESPPVRHLADIVRNSNRFEGRWGFYPMAGWLDAFAEAGLVRRAGTPARWTLTADGGRAARSP
ncbi:MAG: galactosyltransferase-related protein [Actinomycetota bacterium]|nr:galactosyltransferase-related protein [Actinomycetota bacterium]